MPAKSAKQERFMQAVAHNPKFAAEAGVPQKVGREFTKKRFADGGGVPEEKPKSGSNAYRDAQLAGIEKEPKVPKARPYVPNNGLVPRSAKEREGDTVKRDELRKKLDAATFAKGGSIDGCAQRGKTRAGRR